MISKTLQLSNNQYVHYLEQGQGEPLVLIHGVGMQAEAWYPQIEFFANTYHVISLDMPGHGQSTALTKDATLQDFVAWAIECIEKLNLGAVNLAGHSMGSLISSGVSMTRPDLVKRVAVLNGVHCRTVQARQAVIARADALKTGDMDIETPLKRWFSGDSNEEVSAAKKVKSWLLCVDLASYATAYSAFAHGDETYADEWQKVSCPALILTGEFDANSTPEMTISMANKAKQGQAIVVKGQRHMVNLTAPKVVNHAMKTWLEANI